MFFRQTIVRPEWVLGFGSCLASIDYRDERLTSACRHFDGSRAHNSDDFSVDEKFSVSNKKKLEKFISDKKFFITDISSEKISDDNVLDKIKKINEKFIKSQDKKFSLSIEYVLKKFEEEQEDFK